MYGGIFKLVARPGRMNELLAFLRWDAAEAHFTEPDTLRFDVWPVPGEERALYLYEAYANIEGFTKHKQHEPYSRFESEIEPTLLEPNVDRCVVDWCESLISNADRTPIEGSQPAEDGLLRCKSVPESADAIAPDGSDVRVLLALARGGLAHFELAPGETSIAVRHRTVEEIWYFIGGNGEMWRSHPTGHEFVDVGPGVCITIPVGTHFQFRSTGSDPLAAIGVTMPPWPGEGEAIRSIGPWDETVSPGPGLADE